MSIPWAEIQMAGQLGGDRSQLPPFLGPTLRGALGFCLRDLAPAVYPLLFEGDQPGHTLTQSPPSPLIFQLPELPGPADEPGRLIFGVRLLGPAVPHWKSVALAMAEAGRRGLGAARLPWALDQVVDVRTGRLLSEDDKPETLCALQPQLEPIGPVCRWQLLTPLRIRDDARICRHLEGLTLALAARRRLELLSRAYNPAGHDPETFQHRRIEAHEFRTIDQQLRPIAISRYSTRQHRRMTLYGLTGHVTIRGPWPELRWLSHVQWAHLGKATSFGFGRVSLNHGSELPGVASH